MPVGVEEVEVAVVGAGPGGLASAVTLGAYGVETLVLERRLSPSTLPRANAASTGTMELMRRWGLEQAARERSLDVEFQALATPTLAAAGEGQAIDVGFPTRDQAGLVSPTAPASIGQDDLEPLLEARASELPGTTIERGVELLSMTPRACGGYALALAGPAGGRTVHARYVIGADGMRSTVRQELGIAIEDSGSLAERLGIRFRAPLWDLLGEHRFVIYFITGGNEDRALIPAGKPDRWVFAISWDETPEAIENLSEVELTNLVAGATGYPELPITVEQTFHTSYGVGLAQRFGDGDAFLIGDAAHRVTPRGATGLNTAIRDGFDIGWKLAWVLRDWAGPSLLDTYERERRPVAEFNAQRSSTEQGSIIGNGLGLAADIGGRVPHAWVERRGGLVSTLDLLGEGLTLFAGPDWDGSEPLTPGAAPMSVERIDAISARALCIPAGGSVLATPDGRPVAMTQGREPAGVLPGTASGEAVPV